MALLSLSELQSRIEHEMREHPHLRAIRDYNRTMIAELGKTYSLPGKALLDLGASVHGYALEAALEAGVHCYEGIDWDISRHWSKTSVEIGVGDGKRGRLQQMNAERLEFPDDAFDCLVSISTFEHFLQPQVVLAEMFRVLRSGGVALLSFEPIWTASYGHHLHHFGAVSELVPPWSHLFLKESQMRASLRGTPWPEGAAITQEEAIQWIYCDSGINRLSVRELRTVFEASPFEIAWICPIADHTFTPGDAIVEYVSRLTTYSAEELLTRGLSVLLRKP
ncbi:hypothetical protein BH20VER1_BH20VER1_18750 [soil metagenome]